MDAEGRRCSEKCFENGQLRRDGFGVCVCLQPAVGNPSRFSGPPALLDLEAAAAQVALIWSQIHLRAQDTGEKRQAELQAAEEEAAEEEAAEEEAAEEAAALYVRKALVINYSTAPTRMDEIETGLHRAQRKKPRAPLSDNARQDRYYALVQYSQSLRAETSKRSWQKTQWSLLLWWELLEGFCRQLPTRAA